MTCSPSRVNGGFSNVKETEYTNKPKKGKMPLSATMQETIDTLEHVSAMGSTRHAVLQ